MLTEISSTTKFLDENTVINAISESLKKIDIKDKKILMLVPDKTRHCPLPLIFKTIYKNIGGMVKKLDVMVALGTHRPMTEDQILDMFNLSYEEKAGMNVAFMNHAWDDPSALTEIGTICSDEISKYTGGLLEKDVPVTINKKIFEYDRIFIIGPTFPHEVAGFSGGYKYFFPGVSGEEIIYFFHWVGALITSMKISGVKENPARKIIEKCASLIDMTGTCYRMVDDHDNSSGMLSGEELEAWVVAADLAKQYQIG